MTRALARLVYAVVTVVAAVALLAGSSLAVERVRETRIENDARRGSLDYLSYNRRAREHVFRVTNLAPGQVGDRLLVIGNDGRRYIQRISLVQDRVENTGFGRALKLQVFDRTTGQCIFPRNGSTLPRRAVRSRGCTSWGTFDARSQLRGARLAPLTGKSWRPGERHVLAVRYKLMDWSTNSDQQQRASFRFWWRYHG